MPPLLDALKINFYIFFAFTIDISEFFEKIVKKFWLFRPKGILPRRAGIE